METAVGLNVVVEPELAGSAAFMAGSGVDSAGNFLGAVGRAAEALDSVRRHALQATALMSTGQAAALAADVEAMSRTVDYLQVVCAGALESHRVTEAFGATSPADTAPGDAPGGWNNTWAQTGHPGAELAGGSCPEQTASASAEHMGSTSAECTAAAGAEFTAAAGAESTAAAGAEFTAARAEQSLDSRAERTAGRVRAEFRSTADYMRCRLRIGRAEAQRRLKLAASLLPSSNLSGQPVPADLPALAEAAARGLISSAAAGVIANSMEEIRPRTDAAAASAIEADLTSLAAHQDGDFLIRTSRRWVLVVNQDGSEPTDEELHRFQGIFPGRKKNGLNHLSIYCTDDQHETLLTVMNAAAGPRISGGVIPGRPNPNGDHSDNSKQGCPAGQVSAAESPAGDSASTLDCASARWAADKNGTPPDPATASRLDRRTRPQRLLAGLVDAAKAALASGGVPAAGGLRPQVLVTIDSASLLRSVDFGSVLKSMDDSKPESHASAPRPGSFAFSGPVPAATVRKLACDADLLPVVLSGEGRILDIGRAQRLFPPHLRKALHSRDGGCAFPGCTIPGPWTEAHHIRYWNRGGRTSADNGVLLCSHHHHEVHKENWRIEVESGVPWFVPPAYVDPGRVPLRNMFFRTAPGSGSRQDPPDTLRAS